MTPQKNTESHIVSGVIHEHAITSELGNKLLSDNECTKYLPRLFGLIDPPKYRRYSSIYNAN